MRLLGSNRKRLMTKRSSIYYYNKNGLILSVLAMIGQHHFAFNQKKKIVEKRDRERRDASAHHSMLSLVKWIHSYTSSDQKICKDWPISMDKSRFYTVTHQTWASCCKSKKKKKLCFLFFTLFLYKKINVCITQRRN